MFGEHFRSMLLSFNALALPIGSLILFLVVFAAVAIRVLRRPAADFESMASLPLAPDDDLDREVVNRAGLESDLEPLSPSVESSPTAPVPGASPSRPAPRKGAGGPPSSGSNSRSLLHAGGVSP
jgi:hypothetical protein